MATPPVTNTTINTFQDGSYGNLNQAQIDAVVAAGNGYVLVETDKDVYITAVTEETKPQYIQNIQNSPAGNVGEIQLSNGNAFISTPSLKYDFGNGVLTVPSVSANNITSGNLLTVAALTVTQQANLGNVGNLTIIGGSNGQFLQTDGNGHIAWANLGLNGSFISNGGSNLAVDYNGNIRATVTGVANVFVISDDGTDIAGYLAANSITANSATINGNLNAAAIVGSNLRTTGNVTSGNVLTGNITANGNVTSANLATGNLTATGNISGNNLSIGNNANITGNASVGNISVGGIAASGNVTVANLIASSGITVAANGFQSTIKAAPTLAANYTLTLPINDGNANQVLTTDGTGILTWANAAAPNAIISGNSNVMVAANANVTVGIAGVANILTATANGIIVKGSIGIVGNNIAVGTSAGQTSQSANAVAVGAQAGVTSQGDGAIAVGVTAGTSSQGAEAIAIGTTAGLTGQGANSVAVGTNAGYSSQGANAVAIGINAGNSSQSGNAVAIGANAGASGQQFNTIAIGANAGASGQQLSAVAIGRNAGSNNQSDGAVAIGSGTGVNTQGTDAIAIGTLAGNATQNTGAVAVGSFSGTTNQGSYAVAVGSAAGGNTQGANAIAIGVNSAGVLQGAFGIAVGANAGSNNQGSNAIAIGTNSGYGANSTTGQGANAIAIGTNAGNLNQGANSIAIGLGAGVNNQAQNSIILNASGANVTANNSSLYVTPVRQANAGGNIIYYNSSTYEFTFGPAPSLGTPDTIANGNSNVTIFENANIVAGSNGQANIMIISSNGTSAVTTFANSVVVGNLTIKANSVALGNTAGTTAQGEKSVAVGYGSGYNAQGNGAVAIGNSAGNNGQGLYAVAVGDGAGANTQGAFSVAIGVDAASNAQGNSAIAIGDSAGLTSQGNLSVAIGIRAGNNSQRDSSVAVGAYAGANTQGGSAIAVGSFAGETTQGISSIAVGLSAGQTTQGSNAIAIGSNAASNTQGANAVAIGVDAGANSQGTNSVAIGKGAGANAQIAGSIIINATGAALDAQTYAGLYVKPVRNDLTNTTNLVYYNANTSEISYAPATTQQGLSIATDSFVGDGSSTEFTLSVSPTNANYTTVVVDGVSIFRDRYTLVGNLITFGSAPVSNANIQVTSDIISGSTGIAQIYYGSSRVIIPSSNANIGMYVSNTNIMSLSASDVQINGNASIIGNLTLGGNNTSLGNVSSIHIDGGINGQFLATDGDGGLSWVTAPGAGVGGPSIDNGNSNVVVSPNSFISMAVSNTNVATFDQYRFSVGINTGANANVGNTIFIGAGSGSNTVANNTIIINATGANLNSNYSGLFIAPIRNDNSNRGNVMYYNPTTNEATYSPPVVPNEFTGNTGSTFDVATTTQINAVIPSYPPVKTGDYFIDTNTATNNKQPVYVYVGGVWRQLLTAVNT